MYLAADIGGTKTLLASFSTTGNLKKSVKFPTAHSYSQFLQDFHDHLPYLDSKDYRAGCVALPGKIDRQHGRGLHFGNLPWKNVPMEEDIQRLINAPVIIENDAKVGGYYEAGLIINEFKHVLFISLGTGIGISLIINGINDLRIDDMGGHVYMVNHDGKARPWESFASGSAIVELFGKRAEAITDTKSWLIIARNLAVGLIGLISKYQPDVVVIGGGVGKYFSEFNHNLNEELKKYQTPLTPIPPIRMAHNPDESVIYGCYHIAKDKYGQFTS